MKSDDIDLSKCIDRVKDLKRIRAESEKQMVADDTQLKMLEGQRDDLYKKCSDMGVEPKSIKQEIADRYSALIDDISLIESRFSELESEE